MTSPSHTHTGPESLCWCRAWPEDWKPRSPNGSLGAGPGRPAGPLCWGADRQRRVDSDDTSPAGGRQTRLAAAGGHVCGHRQVRSEQGDNVDRTGPNTVTGGFAAILMISNREESLGGVHPRITRIPCACIYSGYAMYAADRQCLLCNLAAFSYLTYDFRTS